MDFLEKTYWGNTVNEWLIALGIVVGAYVISKLAYWVLSNVVRKLTEKTKTKLDDLLIETLEKPIVYAIVIGGFYFAFETLHVEHNYVEKALQRLIVFAFAMDVTWMISRVLDGIIQEYIQPLAAKSKSEFDDQILPVIRKAIRAMVWILGIIIGLDNLGIDITAMIAGLGIGGLALALAAQDMVKNIFGGIMIFLDKPFKIGDRIKVNGYDGIVEEVGLRSTRVRDLDGRLVIIPNNSFSDNEILNVTSEPNRKVVLNLGLTYDTTPDQMNEAMEILKQIASDHKGIIEEDVAISFNAFGDFSLGILFIYYINLDEGNWLDTPSTINSAILTRFNAKGLDFAFPTQTILKKEI